MAGAVEGPGRLGLGFGGLFGRLLHGFGRDRTTQALLIGLTADAVGLLLLDTRGVALDSDPKLDTEVQSFFIGEAELSS